MHDRITLIISSKTNPKSWIKDIESSDDIMTVITPLKEKYNLSTVAAVYCYINNEIPVCQYNSEKKFTWFAKGFAYCGTRKTCRCNAEASSKKAKSTCISKYGVDSYAKTPEYASKAKETNLLKYGVEHVSHSDEIRNKAKNTCYIKYGTEYPSQLPEFKDKIKQTKLDKYGDETYSNAEKRADTLQKRYGVRNFSHIKLTDFQKEVLFNKDNFETFIRGKSRAFAAVELGVDNNTITKYTSKYECYDLFVSPKSVWEEKIAQVLDNLNVKYIQNTKSIISPFELDFYLPDFNLAIECNGNYWHSEKNGKDKHYHYNKWKKCNELGIQLLQYFEDELIESWDIIESKIRYLTTSIRTSVGARKLSVKELTFEEEHQFCRCSAKFYQ